MKTASVSQENDSIRKRIETISSKMSHFTGADIDCVRFLCSQMFPLLKDSKETVNANKFLDILNKRFVLDFTYTDLEEILHFLGQNSQKIHPYQFFSAVKKAGMPNKSPWNFQREEQIKQNSILTKTTRNSTFHHIPEELDKSPQSRIKNINQLKKLMEKRLRQVVTDDVDYSRQLCRLLDLKNQHESNGVTNSELKKIMFSKFGYLISDKEVETLFTDFRNSQGNIDFKKFVWSILIDKNKQNSSLSFVPEAEVGWKQVRATQDLYFQKQSDFSKLWTVNDVRRNLERKIQGRSSTETDQLRQVFRKLGGHASLNKKDFFVALKINFDLILSDELMDEVFQEIDTDQNGVINLQEFLAFMKEENRGDAMFTPSNTFCASPHTDTSPGRYSPDSRLIDPPTIENLLKGAYNPSTRVPFPQRPNSCINKSAQETASSSVLPTLVPMKLRPQTAQVRPQLHDKENEVRQAWKFGSGIEAQPVVPESCGETQQTTNPFSHGTASPLLSRSGITQPKRPSCLPSNRTRTISSAKFYQRNPNIAVVSKGLTEIQRKQASV